jgi:hypothetical protein
MTTDKTEKLALHPSRRVTLVYLVAALLMDLLGYFAIVAGTPIDGLVAIIVGSIALLFFGAISLILAVQLAWPSPFGLTLDMQGFTVTMNLGSTRYIWKDVDRFFLAQTVPWQAVVAFKYRSQPEMHGFHWTLGLSSFDRRLPVNLSVRGGSLLSLVERWRIRAKQAQ